MNGEMQEFVKKYPSLTSVHLAICEIARLSHAGKHGQTIKALLVKLVEISGGKIEEREE